MRRRLVPTAMLVVVAFTCIAPSANAAVTTSPSPSSPSPVAKSSQVTVGRLNPQQKALLQEAKKSLAASIATAKAAFGLLVADAKANRDQLFIAAKTDQIAMAAAKAKYRSDLVVAQSFLNDAIKQARKIYADSLSKAGIPFSK